MQAAFRLQNIIHIGRCAGHMKRRTVMGQCLANCFKFSVILRPSFCSLPETGNPCLHTGCSCPLIGDFDQRFTQQILRRLHAILGAGPHVDHRRIISCQGSNRRLPCLRVCKSRSPAISLPHALLVLAFLPYRHRQVGPKQFDPFARSLSGQTAGPKCPGQTVWKS